MGQEYAIILIHSIMKKIVIAIMVLPGRIADL